MAKNKSKKDGLFKAGKKGKGGKLLKGVVLNAFNPETFRNQLVVAAIEGVGGQVMDHDSSDEANAADLADIAVTVAEAVMKRLGYAPPRVMGMSEQVAQGLGHAIENEAFDRK